MAIEKSSFKVSRFDSEFSPASKESMSSEEDELRRPGGSVGETDDDDDEFDDVDSGAGSDDCDMLELGETGAEFCQVDNQTCRVPFELYDLPGLEDILSVDVWNECLTEEERFSLTKYLPDMDQETYMRTLKELFTGCNFHFGSPISKLFDMLKGGLCEPRVALYRKGMNFFQKRQHYHLVRKHQNYLVSNLHQIREAWLNYRGFSIEEKLRVLNIMRSQRSLMFEKVEDFDADSSGREESAEALWSRRPRERKVKQKMGHQSSNSAGLNFDFPLRSHSMAVEQEKYGKKNSKGTLKLSGSKIPSARELSSGYPALHHASEMKSGVRNSLVALYRQNMSAGYDTDEEFMGGDDTTEDPIYGTGVHRDRIASHLSLVNRAGSKKTVKKGEFTRANEPFADSFMSMPLSHSHGRNRNVNQFSEIQTFPLSSSSMRISQEYGKKARHQELLQHYAVADQMKSKKRFPSHLPHIDMSECTNPFWHNKTPEQAIYIDSSYKYDDGYGRSKKLMRGRESPDINMKHRASFLHKTERYLESDLRVKASKEKIKGNYMQNGLDMAKLKGSRMQMGNEETESESSEQSDDEDSESNPFTVNRLPYPSGLVEDSQPSFAKSGFARKSKSGKRDTDGWAIDDFPYSGKMGDVGGHSLMPKSDKFSLKAKKKGKASAGSLLHSPSVGAPEAPLFPRSDEKQQRRLEKRGISNGDHSSNHGEQCEATLLGYKRATKKRKGQDNGMNIDDQGDDGTQPSDLQEQADGSASTKKRGKRKLESDSGTIEIETPDLHALEIEARDVELDTKPHKKSFALITPTVHNSFSFSVTHLLSAIRRAIITPSSDDPSDVGKPIEDSHGNCEVDVDGVCSNEDLDVSESTMQLSLPSLPVQEIVNRVKSNPGDPCILETQEPLQDLVRGVLKIFSSKTAPLGAKGWKPLVVYDKSTKSWSWTGPVSHTSADNDSIEEVTSPEAWGLPYKMLVKLVDAFANWLKNGQETLQQLGSLPAPPLSLMQNNVDEKERFRDLRAQKSLNTISPSSEEVRAYFRKEELLRYLIPDRAFSYTAADGKKSIVAPLKRCGGKPTSKARDHFMLKRDRPPHVTILCLVRDAAARLPGSIGTRADVCTLIRDSQYVVEDVSDAQVNQVVSGALDRLHYERDPCVQFDGDRKLWVYLHRDRDEEDFKDDGTSSTKKWKRPKKDTTEQSDQGAATIAYQGTRDEGGPDLCSDLNAEPSCMDEDREEDFSCKDMGQDVENVDTIGSDEGNEYHNHPSVWEPHDLDSIQEAGLICQENSTNEDFDDETFVREKPVR